MNLYFTYSDGLLSYNCSICGGKCCKGYGFTVKTQELISITEHYPTLPLFLKDKGAVGEYLLDNTAGKCWFLDNKGLCKLHSDYGWEAKPITCKLFPVNVIDVYDLLIVTSIHMLCPITIAPPNATADFSILRHSSFVDSVKNIKFELPKQNSRLFDCQEHVEDFIKSEVAVRDSCTDLLSSASFIDHTSLKELLFGGVANAELLNTIDSRLISCLGISELPILAGADIALFIALIATLRYQIIKKMNRPYKRIKSLIPLVVYSLYRYVAVWHKMSSACEIDASTVSNILEKFFYSVLFFALSHIVPMPAFQVSDRYKIQNRKEIKSLFYCALANLMRSNHKRINLWHHFWNMTGNMNVMDRMNYLEHMAAGVNYISYLIL